MKEFMEFYAKTVDEAITKALLELGISSDRLEYEVIEKGSSGILGMFVKPAVIRVARPRENEDEFLLSTPVKEEKKKEALKASEKARPREEDRPELREAAKPERKPAEKETAEPSVKEAAGHAPKNEARPPRPEEKQRPKEGGREKAKEAVQEEKPVIKNIVKKQDLEPALCEPLERVEKFLQDMFGAMQLTVQIETGYDMDEKTIVVDLSGEEMGVLIGKRGQTLDSIQYLVSLVVNKGEEEYIRVKVDTENYRERRKETLESLAKNISYKVKRTRRPVSLEPMNPYERRVIHAALQNDKYVVTRSEGVEPYRHIVISPKNTRYGSKK